MNGRMKVHPEEASHLGSVELMSEIFSFLLLIHRLGCGRSPLYTPRGGLCGPI